MSFNASDVLDYNALGDSRRQFFGGNRQIGARCHALAVCREDVGADSFGRAGNPDSAPVAENRQGAVRGRFELGWGRGFRGLRCSRAVTECDSRRVEEAKGGCCAEEGLRKPCFLQVFIIRGSAISAVVGAIGIENVLATGGFAVRLYVREDKPRFVGR